MSRQPAVPELPQCERCRVTLFDPIPTGVKWIDGSLRHMGTATCGCGRRYTVDMTDLDLAPIPGSGLSY